MKTRFIVASIVCIALFALAGGAVWAASSGMRVNVPFEFTVEKGNLPSGTYEILIDGPRNSVIRLRNLDTGKMTRLSIRTRLADVGAKKAYFVFDKAGSGHFLSEIHLPGSDGYELKGVSKEHQHEKVPVTQ
jgi:hypothetical protein